MILLILASQLARITSTSHWCPAVCESFDSPAYDWQEVSKLSCALQCFHGSAVTPLHALTEFPAEQWCWALLYSRMCHPHLFDATVCSNTFPIFICLFVSLLLNTKDFQYILEISNENIFSCSRACLWSLQKYLSKIRCLFFFLIVKPNLLKLKKLTCA
jgi:hypothetical protein